MRTLELFQTGDSLRCQRMGPRAFVLRDFALPHVDQLLSALRGIEARSPFRSMITPGGSTMSVALTNCGALGWTTDRRGYRYTGIDPDSGRPWAEMPEVFAKLASEAASQAGFENFEPDACLINRYLPGSRLSLHQDRNEQDFGAPIVSVSLGMPATFLFGGHERQDRPARVPLYHGDVAVWGGTDRLRFHGVMPMKDEPHPLLGSRRINLTFRKAS
jgi:DNA oxidative demethylase